MLKTVAK